MSLAAEISTKHYCATCGIELGNRFHQSPRGNLRCSRCHRERSRMMQEYCYRARLWHQCVLAAKGLLVAACVAPCVYLLLEAIAQIKQ